MWPAASSAAGSPNRHRSRFEHFHTLLGTAVGETIGYALTATFTILFVSAFRRTVLPGWVAAVGYVAAGLIATGVVIPVIEAADLTNFLGYVLWCMRVLIAAGYLAWGRVKPRGRRRREIRLTA